MKIIHLRCCFCTIEKSTPTKEIVKKCPQKHYTSLICRWNLTKIIIRERHCIWNDISYRRVRLFNNNERIDIFIILRSQLYELDVLKFTICFTYDGHKLITTIYYNTYTNIQKKNSFTFNFIFNFKLQRWLYGS